MNSYREMVGDLSVSIVLAFLGVVTAHVLERLVDGEQETEAAHQRQHLQFGGREQTIRARFSRFSRPKKGSRRTSKAFFYPAGFHGENDKTPAISPEEKNVLTRTFPAGKN